MKARISQYCNIIPNIVEYISTDEEDNEIDLFQARKVTDFKRMVLEHVRPGSVVGMAVPIAYEDIMVRLAPLLVKGGLHAMPMYFRK